MEKTIHVHEILNLVGTFDEGVSKEELSLILKEKFGSSLNFTNCSGNKYTFDEALDFTFSRNKLLKKEDKLFLNRQNLCHH